MGTAAHASEVIDNNLQLELFADDLILNHDPLVEHFKSRPEAFKRGNPFYTFIDFEDDYKTSISVKETTDDKVFLVKTRLASQPDKNGGPQVEECLIMEFEREGLADYSLLEKAKKIWGEIN